MALLNLDLSNVEAGSGGFDPIPAGTYPAIITGSEVKATKKGGGMLVLTFEIIDGNFKKRLVWDRLNIKNDSEIAQNIAFKTLASICDSLGVPREVADSTDLHNRPINIRVAIRPAENGYEAGNEISGYSAYSDAPAAAPAPQLNTAPAPQSENPAPAGAADWTQTAGAGF